MQLAQEHATWLEGRGLDVELVTRYGLYTDPQKQDGRVLVIPFLRESQIINRKYRAPGKQFSQDAGAPRSLWNEDCLRDPTLNGEPLIITEGELDALSAIQAGFLRTVSVPDGAGTNLDFLADIWPLIKDIPRIILAGDDDDPGKKLNEELARRLGRARCAFLQYPPGQKDLNAVLDQSGAAGVASVVQGAKDYPIKGLYTLSDYPDVPNPSTYETEWQNLNANLKLWRGEFMVVTGVPSHGKSLWTLNLMGSMARVHGHRTAIASFEVPIVPYVRDIFRSYHGGEKSDADAWIESHFVFLDQDPREEADEIDIEWIIEKAGDAVVRYGIDWLLLDPWNQIDHSRKAGESLPEYQRRAIKTLKRFSRSFGVGVIIVAHPTKDVKDPKSGRVREPGLYDIDGSAHWYNAADHGVVIHRPDMTSNKVNVSVHKSRFRAGGLPGDAWLAFEQADGRYRPTIAPMED